MPKPSRRSVLAGAVATAGAMATPAWALDRAPSAASIALTQVDASLPTKVTRAWVGPMYWGNRVQDWRLNNGRIEHTSTSGRSVGLLTYDMISGPQPAAITVRTGTLATGPGFSGIPIGAGGGALDPRAAALVQAASGTGGGLICTYESDGSVQFRDHTSETNQLSYRKLPVTNARRGTARKLGEDVVLRLDVIPNGGAFDLRGTATVTASGKVLATATLSGVSDAQIIGGISLFSTPTGTSSKARHWFRALKVGGAKIAAHPERAVGPILGALWSLNEGVFKLTAQFLPIGSQEPHSARLDWRNGTGAWITGPTATMTTPTYTAPFRVDSWDATKAWQYRIVYTDGSQRTSQYVGQVSPEPSATDPLTIGVINCTIHTFRPLDAPSAVQPPLERPLGLYTQDNLYFPYTGVTSGFTANPPDLLAALGDQLYENRPTVSSTSPMPTLDYLNRYYLWLWAFRDLTANRPTIVLVDDHDVLQGNIWGHDGAPSPSGNWDQGGYVRPASFANFVQALQCGHNPDPYDPTPVLQGITVYYCTFRYGCVRFAVVEDRKFKGGDANEIAPDGTPYNLDTLPLLGDRQEAFLGQWATMDPGLAKVCFSQTLWGCLNTSDAQSDLDDSDGSAPVARDRALQLVRSANGLLLSGDQHLGSVVRHGINTFADGPVQFTTPAAGSSFQRWFEPSAPLPNSEGRPYTGDFVDVFGNHMHVLAVANPLVSWDVLHAAGGSRNVGDRTLKQEGYGLVRVLPAQQRFEINCYPSTGGAQLPGWPITMPFDT